jgi:hypothetical protein
VKRNRGQLLSHLRHIKFCERLRGCSVTRPLTPLVLLRPLPNIEAIPNDQEPDRERRLRDMETLITDVVEADEDL